MKVIGHGGFRKRIVEMVFQPGNDILDVYLVLIDQILEKQPFPERVWSKWKCCSMPHFKTP